MHLKLAHLSFRNPSDSQDFLWKDICLDVESLEDSGDLSTFVAVDEEIIRANAANSASSRILAIRGPSGSGKTTLLNCIAQLIHSDIVPLTSKSRETQQLTHSPSPVYELNGKTPKQLGVPEWRSRVMYVPQRPPVQPGTPWDLVTLITSFASHKSTSSNQRKRKPYSPKDIGSAWGLPDETWHKEWSALSGGEIQRVSLAIALSRDPDVLLLDEPTSALDPATTLLVEQTILQGGLTGYSPLVLWITHNPEQEARVAQRSLVLGDEMTKGLGKWWIDDRRPNLQPQSE